MDKLLTEAECSRQVGLMARRTALLYYYFAQTLVDELGEQEGRRLIEKAVWAYGEHCGRAVLHSGQHFDGNRTKTLRRLSNSSTWLKSTR